MDIDGHFPFPALKQEMKRRSVWWYVSEVTRFDSRDVKVEGCWRVYWKNCFWSQRERKVPETCTTRLASMHNLLRKWNFQWDWKIFPFDRINWSTSVWCCICKVNNFSNQRVFLAIELSPSSNRDHNRCKQWKDCLASRAQLSGRRDDNFSWLARERRKGTFPHRLKFTFTCGKKWRTNKKRVERDHKLNQQWNQ